MFTLVTLINSVRKSQAVNNIFFDTWIAKPLSMDALAIFARNFWEWKFRFPQILAAIISTKDDIKMQVEYTKILFSEMGNGDLRKVRSTLFEKFCNELAEKFGYPGYLDIKNLKTKLPLLQETQDLLDWQKVLYLDQGSAAGAQLALEWQSYTMISKLYEGARNYENLWSNDPCGFHEACEFFYVHIGEAGEQHKDGSLNAAQQLINEEVSFESIHNGFYRNLEVIGNFWNSIAKAI